MKNSNLSLSLKALGLTEEHFENMKRQIGVDTAVAEVAQVQEADINEEVEYAKARRRELGSRDVEADEDYENDEQLCDLEYVSPSMREAFGE